MELICNELSFSPLPEDNARFEENLTQFFYAFRDARSEFGFTHLRFSQAYLDQPVTTGQNLGEWLNSTTNRTLKETAYTWIRRPFIDDAEEEELNEYIYGKFEVADSDCPLNDSPFGLAMAAIKSSPAISLRSHEFWQKSKIAISRKDSSTSDKIDYDVINLHDKLGFSSDDFLKWLTEYRVDKINSQESLATFLNYSKYSVSIQNDFWNQLVEWKDQNFNTFRRILTLMKDVEKNPFSGGIGKTENLSNRGKEASKRITEGDRLSYSLDKNIVTFYACKGHYTFHTDNS